MFFFFGCVFNFFFWVWFFGPISFVVSYKVFNRTIILLIFNFLSFFKGGKGKEDSLFTPSLTFLTKGFQYLLSGRVGVY